MLPNNVKNETQAGKNFFVSIKVKCSQLLIVHLLTFGRKWTLGKKLKAKPLFEAVLQLMSFYDFFLLTKFHDTRFGDMD